MIYELSRKTTAWELLYGEAKTPEEVMRLFCSKTPFEYCGKFNCNEYRPEHEDDLITDDKNMYIVGIGKAKFIWKVNDEVRDITEKPVHDINVHQIRLAAVFHNEEE